ncbi:MAG: hypothetical protein LUC34_07325 [Campylobacter sp.]|nr:hypothetical protein [Campylobacter sp.]
MKISKEIKERILAVSWLSRVEISLEIAGTSQENDADKVNASLCSVEWEIFTLDASNRISEYLQAKNFLKELSEWNEIAALGREFIDGCVAPKIPEIAGFDRGALVTDISFNVLNFIIENHYAKAKILKGALFFKRLFEIYELGKFPCGYDENFNKIIVF